MVSPVRSEKLDTGAQTDDTIRAAMTWTNLTSRVTAHPRKSRLFFDVPCVTAAFRWVGDHGSVGHMLSLNENMGKCLHSLWA
jgi:hypothetical protein